MRLLKEYIPGSITNLAIHENNSNAKHESDGENEPEAAPLPAEAPHTELVNELHVDYQIYNMVRDSKEFGITQTVIVAMATLKSCRTYGSALLYRGKQVETNVRSS